jgi:hypothetical protein
MVWTNLQLILGAWFPTNFQLILAGSKNEPNPKNPKTPIVPFVTSKTQLRLFSLPTKKRE